MNGQQFDIGGGAFSRDGQNLFHLFKQFGLNDGQIANFLSNPGVRNILAGVNGGDVSYINGLIQVMGGNSNLYLLNPAGIVFGPNAQLNVPAAFHASTASRVHFDGGVFDLNGVNDYANLLGNPTGFEFAGTGIIVNEGDLAVGTGQDLTLMAHQVINTGSLSAPGGRVTIQAVPETGMVRISQEGMILSLEIPADKIPEDGVIDPTDLPKLLTGGEDSPRVNSVVHHEDGSFSLIHDPNKVNIPMEGATAVVSGTVDVSNPEGVGGQINVLGQQVALVNTQLNANGIDGGGTILVGGDYLGGTTGTNRLDSSLNAQNLYVDNNSVLSADALGQGNGGTIINWADNSTQFYGRITARGGELGGDGGFAEVSGRNHLDFQGQVDLLAPQGTVGTLLLDPTDITISNATTTDMTAGPNFTGTANSSTLSTATLLSALAGAHVEISTESAFSAPNGGRITVANGFEYTGADARSLTLNANNGIIFNSGAVISATNAALDVTLNSDIDFATNPGGFIRMNPGSGISSNGGNITLQGSDGQPAIGISGHILGIELDGANLTAGAGNIRLHGQGFAGGSSNSGIVQFTGSQVSTTTGNITYIGTGGSSINDNHGIYLTGENTTINSSMGGAIALTGTGGGNGTDNYGIWQRGGLQGSPQVSTTTGNITYTGTGANGAEAIRTESISNLNLIGNGTAGNITLTSLANGITLNDVIANTTGNLQINSPGNVTQNTNASLLATGLVIQGSGNTTLTNPNNQIQTLAANTTGNLHVVTSTNLTIDTLNPTGIENSNNVILQSTTGNITLNQPINATNDITLVAEQNFINNAGANALDAGGRWLVYSTSPSSNQPGGLTGSEQFDLNYPALPSFSDSGFIYSVAAPLPPMPQSQVVISTTIPTVTVPASTSTPPPIEPPPPDSPPPLPSIILTPVDLPVPPNFSTILQGQEEGNLPLDQSLCQLIAEGDAVLEVDGVPVESALAEQCR